MSFALKKIEDNYIQIYGTITGYGFLKEVNGRKCWGFVIQFFKGSSFIKVSSNPKDGTIWREEQLKDRILKAFNE